MRSIKCLFAVMIGVALPLAAQGVQPVLKPSDIAFLQNQARRIVESARLTPGETRGRWRNTTPYVLHVPGGNMGYPAFWIRDSAMMLGGNFISPQELEGWIRFISMDIQGPEDWRVRPGVLVPAYRAPDHIDLNGKPSFYPGSYETGIKQGGYPFGKYPPLDDNFYFVEDVYQYWRMTHSLALFHSRVRTSSGEMELASLCEHVFHAIPTDPATGLVTAGNIKRENAKDWGFCDGELKSGKLLFPSILRYIAAQEMSRLFRAYREKSRAGEYQQEATLIKTSIPKVFFHSARNKREGWLYSATDVGNQPDVWGSAFAVWSGVVKGQVADEIGRALVRGFQQKTAVREGCVRQILTTDPTNHGGWQCSISKVGTYQNGGYWGTPTGWYITAMNRVDHKVAVQMAEAYLQFLKDNMRPDGIADAWEWFNPDTGRHNNPLYVATVALPYLSLKEAGLLN